MDDRFIQPPYDTLITDIRQGDLSDAVSKQMKKKYMSPLSLE